MKKLILSVIVSVCLINFSLCQVSFNKEIISSSLDGIKRSNSSKPFTIIGEVEGEIVVKFHRTVAFSGQTARYLFFNAKTLKFHYGFNEKFEYNGNRLELIDQFIFNGKLIFVTAFFNQSENIKHYFFQEYQGSGSISSPILIGTVDWSNAKIGIYEKDNRGKRLVRSDAFKVRISDDGNNLVFVYPNKIYPSEKEDNNWNTVIYSSDLEKMNSYSFSLDISDLYLHQFHFSENGTLYFAGIRSVEATGFGDFIGKEYYVVIVDIGNKSNSVVKTGLEASRIVAHSIDMVGSTVVFYGLNGKNSESRKRPQHINSIFCLTMDTSGVILELSQEKLVSGVENLGDQYEYEKKLDRTMLRLKGLESFADGSFIILTEEFGTYLTSVSTPNGPSSYTTYIYGDIIGVYCSSLGEINTLQRITKFQETIKDGGVYSSFFSVLDGNELSLIINDNTFFAKGLNLIEMSNKEKQRAIKNKVISLVSINSRGELNREILIDLDESEFTNATLSSGLITGDNFYFSASKATGKKGVSRKSAVVLGKIGLNLR